MMNSIPAPVERRYANAENFAFAAGQRTWLVHHFAVQIVVLPHHRRVNGVNLDDVVRVRDALGGVELL